MKYKRIIDFSKGLVTDWDGIDSPENTLSDCANFKFYPGKIVSRASNTRVMIPSFSGLLSMAEVKVLAGSTQEQFVLFKDGEDIEKSSYSYPTYAVPTTDIGLDDYSGDADSDELQFLNVKNNVLCIPYPLGSDKYVYWYGYINARAYFNDYYTLTGWYLTDARIGIPYEKVALTTTGTDDALDGVYFVRSTYEYDGYQEGGWELDGDSTQLYKSLAGTEQYVVITLSLAYSAIPKRLTAVNFYVAWAESSTVKPSTAYYHAGKIKMDNDYWQAVDTDYGDKTVNSVNGDIDDSTDPVTFNADTALPTISEGDYIKIDSEIMYVTGQTGAFITATRAQKGTSIAAHVRDTEIYVITAKFELRISRTTAGSSNEFPTNHWSYEYDGSSSLRQVKPSFNEELYTRLNHVLNLNSNQLTLSKYSNAVWLNQRLFVTRPESGVPSLELPYDIQQAVCFSQINKPDVIHFLTDYIDVSTEEGDSVTGIAALQNNLVILKEGNIFMVNMYNSGRALDWTIRQHVQKVGMVAHNSLANGDGILFFGGIDNIYAFSGDAAIPITKGLVQSTYVEYLSDTYSADEDYDSIQGVYDPRTQQYRIYFPSVTGKPMLLFDVNNQAWYKDTFTTTGYIPDKIMLGADHKVYGATSDKFIEFGRGGPAYTESVYVNYESNWMPITNDPYQECRIAFIKGIIDNDSDGYLYIYTDYSNTLKKQYSVAAARTDAPFFYTEVSLMAKVFKVQYAQTLSATKEVEIKDLEIGYEELEDR